MVTEQVSVRDLGVRGAEHQDLYELVEDHPVSHPAAVAAQRLGVDNGWDQCLELVPDGRNEPRWDGGLAGTWSTVSHESHWKQAP